MNHKLEKYLKERRADLDVEAPDDALIWERIRRDLSVQGSSKERKLWPRIRGMAAVAAIILALGYMIGDLVGEGRQVGLATLDRELGAREDSYRELLAVKIQEINTLESGSHNPVIAELYEELSKLDTIYAQCLEDMQVLGYNEQIIHTIFDTYEKKIYLLELIILETNKMNAYENQANIIL
jgi:hypothetical protein